jgi:hypothetical protein
MDPVQGMVLIDSLGDFELVYENLSDPLLIEYLQMRQNVGYKSPVFDFQWRNVVQWMNPIKSNLTAGEYVPTNAFALIKVLAQYFPNHHLIVSDFHSLPEAVEGIDGPVVQTRFNNEMIPSTTILVKPGIFDIFFPTNFSLLKLVYKEITGKDSSVHTHKEFLEIHGDLAKTTTKNGENPMLEYYQNASFLIS